MELIPVEPIGSERRHVLVDRADASRSGMELVTDPVYPETPERLSLRRVRTGRGITLRRAAELLGMTMTDLSRLEQGSHTLSAADWSTVLEAIRDA